MSLLDMTADEFTPDEAKALVAPILATADGSLQVEVGGAVATKSQTVAAGSEGLGLIVAAIILLITFGSVVAMGLPLITALFGLGVAMALGEVLRRFVDVPEWAPYTAAMVGLGVGIDYALLIVTRFRSSLADGQDPRGATQTAISTAGRAVLFAGMTVVISMLGILLMGQPAMNGFAFIQGIRRATARLPLLLHDPVPGSSRGRAPARDPPGALSAGRASGYRKPLAGGVIAALSRPPSRGCSHPSSWRLRRCNASCWRE